MAKDNQDDLSPEERKSTSRLPGPGLLVPLMLLAVIAGYLFVLSNGPKKISSQMFIDQLKAKNVAEVELFTRYAVGKFKELPQPLAEAKGGKTSEKAPEQPATSEKTATAEKTAEKAPDKTKPGDREAALSFMVTLPALGASGKQ